MSFWQNNRFWRNKKVLVTGASGFVGSHLVKKLLQKKSNVVTLSKNRLRDIEKSIKEELGSVEDFKRLEDIIRTNKIDIIFHLAAQPIVEVGQINPVQTFEVNVRGTWNVLEAARQNHIQKIIIASTAQVYGNNPKVPLKEEYFPQPSRPYETSKACADLLAQSFADTYNLPVEIPRFVNIYGPGDLNFERLIPKVIKSILKYGYLHIWDLGSIRDFLYIDDAICAYLMLAEKQIPNIKRVRVFNFGTGKPISIHDLIKKIIELVNGSKISIKTEEAPEERSNEIKKQYLSIAKARRELGWLPRVSLETGLKKTIRWYKENSSLLL